MASLVLEAILFYLYYFPEQKLLLGDESRYYENAISILNGGNWQPHFFWPPLQSILLAFFFKLFGESLLPFQLFQYLLLVISALMVRDIVFRETGNFQSSQVGFAVMLLFPSWLAYSHFLWPEVIHVFLFVSILWINNYKKQILKWAVLSGVFIALALLAKSLLLLFIPFLLWPSLLDIFNNKKRIFRVQFILIQLVVMLIVLSPFAINSKKNFNSWMISNSSMFNLYVGLNDESRQNFIKPLAGKTFREYMKTADTFSEREAIIKEKVYQQLEEQGVITTFINQISKQYFRLFNHNSFLSDQFQGEIEKGQKNRYSHPLSSNLVQSVLLLDKILYTIVFAIMLYGVIWMWKSSPLYQQCLLFLLYNLGLFLLLHAKTRFRIPLVPLFAIYAGVLFESIRYKKLLNDKKKVVGMIVISFIAVFMTSFAELLDFYFPL
jgi:4-amino-4-deoxy-L-arabinose transferase-like glycosyltransferase